MTSSSTREGLIFVCMASVTKRVNPAVSFLKLLCKEVCPEMFKFGCPIDRAHRIGKTKTDGNGVTTQAIIRFTTFRDRTAIHRARKDIKNKLKYGISLDLIPSKLTLLSEARKLIDGVEGIHFVYSDINCYTRAFLKNGQHKSVITLSELQDIITNL